MSREVGPGARVADGAAVAIATAGILTYLHAADRLRAIADGRLHAAPGTWMITLAERYEKLAHWGMVLTISGALLSLASFLRYRRQSRPR
ncbi:MAG: hypothetical protein NVS9B3_15570 [Gemmatimonadaceae bacterium]